MFGTCVYSLWRRKSRNSLLQSHWSSKSQVDRSNERIRSTDQKVGSVRLNDIRSRFIFKSIDHQLGKFLPQAIRLIGFFILVNQLERLTQNDLDYSVANLSIWSTNHKHVSKFYFLVELIFKGFPFKDLLFGQVIDFIFWRSSHLTKLSRPLHLN